MGKCGYFHWEWGRNPAPREEQKMPWYYRLLAGNFFSFEADKEILTYFSPGLEVIVLKEMLCILVQVANWQRFESVFHINVFMLPLLSMGGSYSTVLIHTIP